MEVNMTYLIPRTLKHETKIFKKLYIRDISYIGAVLALAYFSKGMVHVYLQVPYWIFAFIVSFYMVSKPNSNPQKHKFKALALYLFRDNNTYYSINHI